MKCPVRKRIDSDRAHKAATWARFLELCQQAHDFGFKGVIVEGQ